MSEIQQALDTIFSAPSLSLKMGKLYLTLAEQSLTSRLSRQPDLSTRVAPRIGIGSSRAPESQLSKS